MAEVSGVTIFSDRPALGDREVVDLGNVRFLKPLHLADVFKLQLVQLDGDPKMICIEYFIHAALPLLQMKVQIPKALGAIETPSMIEPMALIEPSIGQGEEGHLFFAELDQTGPEPVVNCEIRTETKMVKLRVEPGNLMALSKHLFDLYAAMSVAQREAKLVKLDLGSKPESFMWDNSSSNAATKPAT